MLNNINIMGRLTHDPEFNTTSNQVPMASFRIACPRDFKNNGQVETDFVNCVAWRSTAEFISKYFRKGDTILLNGRLQIRNYETKDGKKGIDPQIHVENAFFTERKKEGDTADNGWVPQPAGMPTAVPPGPPAYDPAQYPFAQAAYPPQAAPPVQQQAMPPYPQQPAAYPQGQPPAQPFPVQPPMQAPAQAYPAQPPAFAQAFPQAYQPTTQANALGVLDQVLDKTA